MRRLEVFTGSGRRRIWTAEEKASIVAESHGEAGGVSRVARRHGLSASQLFAWRRAAREASRAEAEAPAFVPALVAAAGSMAKAAQGPVIELAVGGSNVRIWRDADVGMVATVIGALKARA